MPIKCTTDLRRFDELLKTIREIVFSEIKNTLSFLGEQCVRRIKDRSAEESWIDQTGNLRSSIGYAIYDYGKKMMQSSFDTVLNGSEGSAEGKRFVNELATQFANVYALVVVAGMNYAAYVEAIESKDVLASTELWAKAKVNDYVSKAKERAIRRIKAL